MGVNSQNKKKFHDYEGFVEKFKPKKTTDDCYTPDEVYQVVLDFVVEEYGIDRNKVVRPFYPGGDYENYDYSNGAVVIDNPPFSILKQIKDFYVERDIPFFLFAPGLTLFGSKDHESVNYVVVASQITYENGAKVNSSFVTNLGDTKIWLCQKLNQRLKSVQDKKPSLAKYRYPSCVISGALAKKYIDAGRDIKIGRESCARIEKSKLDQQRELGKTVYGGGYFVSKEIASELERGLERGKIIKLEQEKELDYIWKLSDREKDIVGKLK